MYDREKHHRRSIRLKNYNYSNYGLYFVTICCARKTHYFGKITDGEMKLNPYGNIVENAINETSKIRENDVDIHCYVIMPNHIHLIIEILNENNNDEYSPDFKSTAQSLSSIVRGIKSMISGKIGFTVWQRNYYEHIIRDYNSYIHIFEYIISNPYRNYIDKIP